MDFDYAVAPATLLIAASAILWLSIRHLRALPSRTSSKSVYALDLTILSGVNAVLLGVGISSCVNAAMMESFRVKNPEPGADYKVNGHRMHLNCTGAGSPTLVLDAGLGWDSLEWGGIQPVLAQSTQVCSYDRAGFGLSEKQPGPRDAVQIAGELHALLGEAGVSGPLVLMGHSIAGMYIRAYASRYPAQVAGLVFVDSSTPLQNRDPRLSTAQGTGLPLWASVLMMRGASIAGYPRWKSGCVAGSAGPNAGFSPEAAALLGEDMCAVKYESVQAEFDSFDASGEETVETGPYGDLPILVISQDTTRQFSGHSPTARELEFASTWNGMQEKLKDLSTRGRRIIAKGSSHDVTLNRPDVIEREVPRLIEEIRGSGAAARQGAAVVIE